MRYRRKKRTFDLAKSIRRVHGPAGSGRCIAWSALAALALAACTTEIPHHYQNEGRLCVYPVGVHGIPAFASQASYPYPADAAYDVVVAFKSCLSGGCSKDLVTSCSVTESGGALQVTSEGSYVELDKGAWGGCDADCRLFSATCATPVLPAGDRVIQHGQDTLVLTLPSTGPPPCTGAFSASE